jgi:pentatricopeptide repeat protein
VHPEAVASPSLQDRMRRTRNPVVTEQSTENITAQSTDHYVEALQRFRGDIRMMEQVLATMIERGEPRSAAHLEIILDEYLASRSLRKARAIIGQLEELGVSIDPVRQYDVAIATATAGSAGEALGIIDRLAADQRDPSPTQAPTVLDLLLAGGRGPQAWSLFRRMRARGQRPSREAHLTLLADCLQRRAAKDTVATVQSMRAAGQAVPDGRSGPLLRMLVGLGQLDRAIEVLGLLEESAAEGGGKRPGDDAYGALLQALAAKGRVEDVLAVAARLSASGEVLSSHHRNAVLAARISSGDLEGAWADAEEMWAEASLPTGANLEGLLDMTLAAGNVARAAGVLDLLLVIGVPVTSQRSGAVIRAEMAADGLDRVLPVVTMLLDQGCVFDRAAARDLVERLVRARRLDEARAWLARFRTSGTLTQGRSYGSLLTALVTAKRVDDAVGLLEEMVSSGVRPEQGDLARLVTGRLKAGDTETAERVLTAASGAGVHAEEATLRELMWTHARRSDVAAVDRAIALLRAAGVTPDERHEKARAWASGETPRRLEDGPTSDDVDGPAPDGPPPAGVAVAEPAPPAEPAPSGDRSDERS